MSPSASSPSIAFNPALVLQRQAFLLETLRNVKPKSVLDVGCGEGRLLDCLVRCDEALPVELLAGIDISLRMLEQASRSIESTAEDQQADGRWRSLDIILLRGPFTQLGNKPGVFEAVTSSEVIEHLDPPDLERFWEIHLGVLQPNTLIITTPNREFNILFETVEELSGTPGRSFTREGLDYPVRHDDHRFEYTRAEFEEVSRKAAAKFGYEVAFTGVGTPHNALNVSSELLDQFPRLQTLGYCTQIAVFTRSTPRIISSSTSPNWGNFEVVTRLNYPCNIFTPYPPDPDTIATSLGAMWRQFRPEFNVTQSKYRPSSAAKIFGGLYIESDDNILSCQISLDKLWDLNYSVGKLCRFNKDVFFEETRKLDGRAFDRGIPFSQMGLIEEFVGIEVCSGSLRSFRFARVNGEMHILYEFSKDIHSGVPCE